MQHPAEGGTAEPGKETLLQCLHTQLTVVPAGKGETFTRGFSSVLQSRRSRVDLELRVRKLITAQQFSSLYSIKEEMEERSRKVQEEEIR